MPAEPPKTGGRRRPSMVPAKLDELHELLESELDDPLLVLESILHALTKNQDATGLFDSLHGAAVRHDKVSELAFAYEHVTGDKRIKLMAPEQQAIVYLQAARFFGDTFGDTDGAVAYAERAAGAVPGHPEAFTRLETLLTEAEQPLRLARFYVDAALHEADRGQQLLFLSRAAELVEGEPGADDLAIEIYGHILRIEPDAAATRAALEQRLLACGRHRDAVQLLEQSLERDPPPDPSEAQPIRERLVARYMNELGEPQRAMPHVEALLASDPDHAMARAAAEALLEVRAVAARATAALSDAYERLGQLETAAAMLAQELKSVRGPRRVDVQRRLSILKQDVLNDPAGALELMAPVVAGDPGDDVLRGRFVALSGSLDQPLEAARLLQRALQTNKDPAVRARVGAEIGSIFMQAGDVKNAEAAFRQVLEIDQDDGAVLQAAGRLSELYAEAGEIKPLAQALELVVKLEPERERRQAAARRLARLCESELEDPARAVIAHRALIGSPWTDEALRKLEALYHDLGDQDGLAEILALRAERTRDPEEARELMFRSAELRSANRRDRGQALEAWLHFVGKYGPSREAHARLIPLLEQHQRFEELAQLLEREVELADAAERPALLSRLAHIRATKLGDPAGALGVFRQALAANPEDRTSRAAVEKLLSAGALRLQAADILEPIYRREAHAPGLIRVLETRAELAPERALRLRALAEAVELAEGESDANAILRIAARGLKESVESEPLLIEAWIERVQRPAAQLGDAALRAEALSAALEDRAVDRPEMLTLCRATAEALVAAGDITRAVEVFRRALAFAPAAEDLLGRMDELLSQQGSGEERLTLFRAALERESDPKRRRELYHSIATLQRREDKNPALALETWRAAVADDPHDALAHQALMDAYEEVGDYRGMYSELVWSYEQKEGERKLETLLRMAEVALEAGDGEVALAHYRTLLAEAELGDETLARVEELAQSQHDPHTARAVLERRVILANEVEERSVLLERLGNVQAWQLADPPSAARAWRESARLVDALGVDPLRATTLYERVLSVESDDREAAERLLDLYARSGHWQGLPHVFAVLLRHGASSDLSRRLLELSELAGTEEALPVYAGLVDAVLAKDPEPSRAQALQLSKARVLAQSAAHRAQVATTYRALLESAAGDDAALAAEFAGQLATLPQDAEVLSERRWLLRFRAEHSDHPGDALMAWAEVEEQEFGNVPFALALYERMLEREPDRLDALTELARLRAGQGDAKGAVSALSALRDRSDGVLRTNIELSMASLFMEQLGQAGDALDVIEPLVRTLPPEPEALRIVYAALGFTETRARAAELLDGASEASEDPSARAHVLETLLALPVEGAPELADTRRRWYRQLLNLSSADDSRTLDVAVRAAREFPVDSELWDAAERLARKLSEPQPLLDAYTEAMGSELPPETAEALGRRMIEFHEEWFDDTDGVVRLLKQVLEISPDASWAFDRLKLSFNSAGRWAELFDLYDHALERPIPTATAAELLREAAMAAKDFAGDAERAIHYLERQSALCPEDARIDAGLERLYERHGHARPLIQLLHRRLSSASPQASREISLRIAALWMNLNEAVPAFEIIEGLLAQDVDDPAAIALLERLVELPESGSAVLLVVEDGERSRSVRDRSATHLRRYYERSERVPDAVRMREIEIEALEQPDQRAAALLELFDLRRNKLQDFAGALKTAADLLVLEPANAAHRDRLRELSELTDSQAERAALLIEVAESQTPTLQADLLNEAAGIHEALGEAGRAIDLYGTALAGEAEPALALHAARRLDALLLEASRMQERCTVLERRAELEPEADGRRAALAEAARVADQHLADVDRAVRNWRKRLDDEPADTEALDGLVDVLNRAQRWDDLTEALLARAELEPTSALARTDRVRVAELHARARGDHDAAIRTWFAIRRDFGADPESREALATLLEGEERWTDLADLLAEEASAADDRELRSSLFGRLGQVYQHRTHDVLRALRSYVSAADWDRAIEVAASGSGNLELGLNVCRSLLELATQAWKDGEAGADSGPARAADWAIDELSQRLLEVGQHADVVELLLRGAALPLPKRRRRELRREAACLCSDRLDAPERAMTLFRELFAEDAADDIASASVTRLSLLLEEHELHEEIVALWEEQARARQRAGDVAASAALWARAAELSEQRLADIERALTDYAHGAGLGGDACLEALARIHEGRGEAARAAEVLEWLCAQSPRDQLASRGLRLAEAYVAAGDRGRARARLEYVAQHAIDAGAARRRLAELYRDAGEWLPLAELLTVEAARAADVKTRLSLLREAAFLHLEQRSDPASAVPLLEQAVELSADDPALTLSLSDALRLAERYDEAAHHLREQIARYGARRPKDRALVHWALARVSLARGQRAEALEELTLASKIDPAHPGILQALARLAFEEGQIERAEKMYRALLLVHASASEGAPSRAEALLDLSEIAAQKQDRVRAVEFIESAFEAALQNEHEAASLERSLRTRNRPELLVRALEERLKGDVEPREAARLLADLAELQMKTEAGVGAAQAKLRERALRVHYDLERASVSDDAAWAALGGVYAILQDTDAEQRVIERRVALSAAGGNRLADATPLFRLAEIRLRSESSVEEAIGLLERALLLTPDYERAEHLLSARVHAHPTDEHALALLEKVARDAGRQRSLIDALALTVALPSGPRPEAMREGLALALAQGEPELAQRILERALGNESAPLAAEDAAFAQLALADLHERAGRPAEAEELRERGALLLPPGEAREVLLGLAGRARETGDVPRAARLYEVLRERQPADRDVWQPLLELYRQAGDTERLVTLLDQTVPLSDSAPDRALLRLEQATLLLTREGREEEAIRALNDILGEDRGQTQAATLLAGILERTGKRRELTELLQTRIEAAKDTQDVVAIVELSLKLGGLLEEEGRTSDALETYRGVLDWDAANREALLAIVRLSEGSADAFVLADALEGLLRVERGPAAEGVGRRLLSLRAEQGDEAGAERALTLAVAANPASAELRETLVQRLSEREAWLDAASVLRGAIDVEPRDPKLLLRLIELYRQAEEPERALEILERRMAEEPSSPELFRERSQFLRELGRDDEALLDLESAYALGGDYSAELVEALERAVARVEPPADRELTLRLVQVLEDIGDLEGARVRLSTLVKEAPRELGALRQLAQLEMKSGQYAAASSTYRRLLALEEGPQVIDAALRLADACEQAERFVDARGGLERALKIDPGHPEVRARLKSLYIAIGAQRELCGLLLDEAQAQTDVTARHELLLEAGELLLQPEGSVEDAIRVLDQAHSLSQDDIRGVVLLARAYGLAKRSEEALRILNETALAYRGRRVKQLSAVYREISAIQLMEGFLTDALTALGKAFEMDMRNGQLAMQLGQLALDMDEEDVAVRAFRSVTMMKPAEGDATDGATGEAKADAHYFLAVVSKKQGDLRKARVLVSKALSENPSHESARELLHDLDVAERPA
ncbi:MAG TPA: tetratricopeptide repeat protein [Polyangiaceae bacterium]